MRAEQLRHIAAVGGLAIAVAACAGAGSSEVPAGSDGAATDGQDTESTDSPSGWGSPDGGDPGAADGSDVDGWPALDGFVPPDDPRGTFSLELPLDVPPHTPFGVRIALNTDVPWSGEVTATWDGQARVVRLFRGRGTATLMAPSRGEAALALAGRGIEATSVVQVADRPLEEVDGDLGGEALRWDASHDVYIPGEARVPKGATLTVQPGTRVLLGVNARLVVEGAVDVQGTAAAPVLFTSASASPWGEVSIEGEATLSHAFFVNGGGDSSRAFGHSDSQPVIRIDGGRLSMEGGAVLDSPGKAFGSVDAHVSLGDVAIARCDTGGEHERSEVLLEECLISEIPDGDGQSKDDDNDALYLRDAMVSGDGEVVWSRITGCVLALGEDDGIDHNEARVEVSHTWIEGFAHEGIAASNGRRIVIRDSVVAGCAQGIEAGYGSPEVVVEHCLVTKNGVGLRFGDDYDWEDSGSLAVTHTVAVGNADANVLNWSEPLGGPSPKSVQISCSMVDSAEWDGVAGNLPGKPAWGEPGCITDSASLLGASCATEILGPRGCP